MRKKWIHLWTIKRQHWNFRVNSQTSTINILQTLTVTQTSRDTVIPRPVMMKYNLEIQRKNHNKPTGSLSTDKDSWALTQEKNKD